MQHTQEAQLTQLPPPEPEALALSRQLLGQIRQAAGADGLLPFDRFMELALYAPGLGYYANGLETFGAAGDFITAPELSPLFGRCLARQTAEVLEAMGGGDVLEFGAGSGRLALDLLAELDRLGQLPRRYCILELSARLRAQQQALLGRQRPDLYPRLNWLERLPEGFCGVMLANEVVDAMPVSRFCLPPPTPAAAPMPPPLEQFVDLRRDAPQLCWRPLTSPGLAEPLTHLTRRYRLAAGYESEINLRAGAWLEALGQSLRRGLLLIIDYGYNGQEFYHPQRRQGSLICHYRHRAHDDPLLWPGLQDISANVDFSALAEAASAAGFDSQAFTSQAYFLLANGIQQLIEPADGPRRVVDLQAVKQLTLPNEMGERFKVLGLGKGLDRLPQGFALRSYAL
ncbi:MAG: SAM-dependent methyltransferase [Gammaproteobacteria bacterium SHHR-1]|uniref:class I SAM-dependent methyltransferase n=1 Tax=Magnetovirga frankeli TaxID=947516 RepID=UPI0012932991|nr:SAM-dependent methyltransferase [gamma proteobacterium SS-5]